MYAIRSYYDILSTEANLSFDIEAVDNDGDVSAAQPLDIHQVASTPGQGGVVPPTYFLTASDDGDHWFATSSQVDDVTGSAHSFDGVDYSDRNNFV